MDIKRKRLLKLMAGFLCCLCLGVTLDWSLFVIPIETLNGWTRSQISLAFTKYCLISPQLKLGALRQYLVMSSMLLIVFAIVSILILFVFMKSYSNEMKKRNEIQKQDL